MRYTEKTFVIGTNPDRSENSTTVRSKRIRVCDNCNRKESFTRHYTLTIASKGRLERLLERNKTAVTIWLELFDTPYIFFEGTYLPDNRGDNA